MVERRPGVMPPKPGPPPRRRPSARELVRRRAGALVLLVLALGGLGWLAVAAIGGGSSKPGTSAAETSSSLIYSTVTRTTNGKTTETVIAMPKPFHVVFPEGFTIREMAARVGAVKGIAERKRHVTPLLSSRGYLAAVRRATAPRCLRGRRTRMEGFLFPATFEFFRATTNAQLVQEQLAAFCDNWSRVDLGYARKKNLTAYDVLIIASMVEKETLSPDERPLVAAVIYNRLHARMPLGIDATLRYGLDIPPTKSIRESQLHSNSSYNTRKRRGLPPMPIANPGLASMQAAAHPAKVDYLYFVRKPDKKHHFFTASYKAFRAYADAHGYGRP
ncbi:MAG: endolytic transglycosylase MltG [Actinobacteria bacterium]|nr:MAG: endolytic transglycosylase MltG [Actinomycetota bacterium]